VIASNHGDSLFFLFLSFEVLVMSSSVRALSVIDQPWGGYQRWLLVDGWGDPSTVVFNGRMYFVHATLSAPVDAAEALGVVPGATICGVRWSERVS
jgi:hypothetical protein